MAHLIGKVTSFEGQLKPSAIEVDGYDQELFAHRHTEIETNQQGIWIYNGSNQVLYACYAARGLSTSTNGWLLQKFTYDGSGNVTQRQIAYDAQTNYLTATYA